MTSKASDLVFWATSDPEAQSLAATLCSAATQQGRKAQLCPDPDATRTALGATRDTFLCLLYTAPDLHLAQQIGATSGLESATQNWRQDAQALCALFRQNRQTAVVFEAGQLRRYASVALDRLNLTTSQSDLFDAPPAPGTAAPVLRLMAQAHLQNQPDLDALAQEMRASTTSLSNDDPVLPSLSVQDALKTFHVMQGQLLETDRDTKAEDTAQTHQRAALTAARSERDTLQQQLEKEHSLRDVLVQQNTLLLAEQRALHTEKTHLAQMLETARHTHAQEMALLSEQHTRLSEYHTQLYSQHTEMADLYAQSQARLAKTEQEHIATTHKLEAEHARIMASRSMRLTRPLRTVLGLLRGAPKEKGHEDG